VQIIRVGDNHNCDVIQQSVPAILRQLHWLPVRHRVTFKIAVLVFQCLTGQAPAYLADDCQLTSDVHTRRLRSTDTAMCVVRRSNNTWWPVFCVRCPRLWNTLPPHLRQCDSLGQFKRLLKTHLVGSWDRGALWHLLLGAPCINLLTYLLTYLLQVTSCHF